MLATIDKLPHVSPEEGDVPASVGVMGKLSIGVEPAVGDALMMQHGHKPDEGAQVQWREIPRGVETTRPVEQHPATRDLGSLVVKRY